MMELTGRFKIFHFTITIDKNSEEYNLVRQAPSKSMTIKKADSVKSNGVLITSSQIDTMAIVGILRMARVKTCVVLHLQDTQKSIIFLKSSHMLTR